MPRVFCLTSLALLFFVFVSRGNAQDAMNSASTLTLDLPELVWHRDLRERNRAFFESTARLPDAVAEPSALRNAWGIAYADLNHDLPWILVENRSAAVFALSEPEKARGQSHVAGEFGRSQSLRARTTQTTSSSRWRLEAMAKRRRAERDYFDSRNTPYDSSDDGLSTYRPRQDSGSLKVEHFGTWVDGLGAADFGERDTYAGPRFLGTQQSQFWELDLATPRGTVRPLLFSFVSQSRFRSANASLASNDLRGRKMGVGIDAELDARHFLKLLLAEERQTKTDVVQRRAKFQRLNGEVKLGGSYRENWGKLRWHGSAALVQDQGERQQKRNIAWVVQGEWSSSEQRKWGLRSTASRFQRAPRSSQIFGDGALLDGNPDLPQEQGWRAAAGPWFRFDSFHLQLEAFGQESQNVPILVATSPLRARALPLGGVWTRGAAAEFNWEFSNRWNLRSSLALQQALDASALSAQRGQAIPGIPRQQSRTVLSWSPQPWEFALEHGYRAQETLDLLGKRPRPTRHRFDLQVGYSRPTWRFRLAGRNLFAKQVRLGFEGLAGDSLLDPALEEREFLFNWEFLL